MKTDFRFSVSILTIILTLTAAIIPTATPLAQAANASQSACAGQGTTYEVGPGQTYTKLGAVPWVDLKGCDTVKIHYRSEPYREQILLSGRGDTGKYIRVVGVPDPATGKLPVISGQDAIQDPSLKYSAYQYIYDLGLIMISPPAGYAWGYKPGYISIENLEIRDAYRDYSFTKIDGTKAKYDIFAAAINIERGEHIVIKNCTITNSGNGIFANSKSGEEAQSRDILIEGNRIYGNGVVNDYSEHNIYTQVIGIVMQYNYFGKPRAGSTGNNIKDRSAGTVIRYNYIESGGHMIDLVDPQDNSEIISADPSFHQTYVYGNILNNDTTTLMIQYGGDDGMFQSYRKGTLYFYNNTVYIKSNQSTPERYKTYLFQLETNEETVDARNNIIYNIPETPGAAPSDLRLFQHAGNGVFGKNWVSPGWSKFDEIATPGTVTGTENFISPADNNPGLVNPDAKNFYLNANSSAIDKGETLNVPADKQVLFNYLDPQSFEARTVSGAAIDLGAYEYSSGTPTPTPNPTPNPSPTPHPNPTPNPNPSPNPSPSPTTPFTDTQNHWAKDYITKLQQSCSVKGYLDASGNPLNLFKPDQTITRAELLTMIIKCKYGTLPQIAQKSFTDVAANNWANQYIQKAHQLGIITGYNDNTFHPNQNATRAESLKMILLTWFTNLSTTPSNACNDIDQNQWYAQYFNFALSNNIISGLKNAAGTPTGKCGPTNNITRAEAAKIISNAR